jgi:predicted dehydrogenase
VSRIRIAVVGLGKIARDQHIPILRASNAFELVATASPHSTLDGVPSFDDIGIMLNAVPNISAVALCTAPQVRFDIARYALTQGLHVLLEKPPGATVSEVQALHKIAEDKGVTLFASWHARHGRAVEPARQWLAERRIRGMQVRWRENVRVWHPRQSWVWKAGGLGVFDPGINALSILTRIVPGALMIKCAKLAYPKNCETPIAARLWLADPRGVTAHVELDFRETEEEVWDIEIETDSGNLRLSRGGSEMTVDGQAVSTPNGTEYENLYSNFAQLVSQRRIDVDLSPLQLVADAFLCGQRVEVAPFIE